MTVMQMIAVLETMPKDAVVRTSDSYAISELSDPSFEETNPEVKRIRLKQFGDEPVFVHIG